MTISKPEKAMKEALKDAGRTIADYIDPAPGDERDAEATLDEIIGEIDSDTVGCAIAQSDQDEDQQASENRQRLIDELRSNRYTAKFADLMEKEDAGDAAYPPRAKTGS